MRILITGGTGFIGRPLCAALAADGHDLTVLSRSPERVSARCGAGVTAWRALAEWRDDCCFDAVINLAGEPIFDARWTAERKRRLWDSRVALTRELVARMSRARRRPAVLISGSAIGFYGDQGDAAVSERTGPAGDFLGTLCAAWEKAAQEAEARGVRVCLLRTGLVLHAGGGMLGRMLTPFRLGLGARLGDGRQWMSWIHLDDWVALTRHMLADPHASGPFNLTAPEPVTNAVFTATLARALHRPALAVAPAWLLRAALGERACLLLTSQRVLPWRVGTTLGCRFRYARLDEVFARGVPSGSGGR